MTNGDRIRKSTDEELAETLYLTCDQCVYAPFATGVWDCVKRGWKCAEGRARWLGEEERK